MGVSLVLDKWLLSNKYVHKDLKKFGTLQSLVTDYDIYLKCVATQKIAGVQIDKKSKTFYIGRARSFYTKQTEEELVTKTVTAYKSGEKPGFYDDTLEEKLGGERKTLGE